MILLMVPTKIYKKDSPNIWDPGHHGAGNLKMPGISNWIYKLMKCLKNFTSLFEFDNTDEITNDIFDLWKRIEMDSSGFQYINGICTLNINI